MSHTPSPWHVVTDPELIGNDWMVANTGDYVIESTDIKCDEMGDSLDDANLIAAAPDMYAALLAVLYPAGDTPEEVRAQVKAALEKAAPAWMKRP